jgi:tetratricopeptide (TPR) repeat protein
VSLRHRKSRGEGIVDRNTHALVEEVVTSLRKRDFEALGRNKLITFIAVRKRLGERLELTNALVGRAVGDFVLDAINLMRPSSPEQLSEPAWRHFILLKDYIARGQPWGVVAARVGLGRTAFYNARKDAIASLAMVIEALEDEARRELPQVRHNLLHPPYQYFIRRFVNEEDLVDKIIEELAGRAWVIAICGAAGVGKTTLAYEVAKQCCERRDFDAVIWTSMKEEELEPGGIIKLPSLKRPNPVDERVHGTTMTFGYETPLEAVLESIGRTLQVRDVLAMSNLHEKRRRVSQLLSTNSCLVVIDNLETIVSKDAQDEIFTFLKELPVPSKAIVTSRTRHYIGETIVTVPEMGKEEAFRFMRVEMGIRGLQLDDEELAAVYEKTGGVAKAMQYVLGLMHIRGYSVEQAVEPGVEQDILLDYLFGRSYEELEEREKMILHVMPLFAEPAPIDAIGIAGTVPEILLRVSLGRLYQLFLLDKIRLDQDRYELPLLAQSFLKSIRRDGLTINGKLIGEFLGTACRNLAQHYANRISERKSLEKKLAFLKYEKRNVISVIKGCYNSEHLEQVTALMRQVGHPLDILGYWDERIELGEKASKAASFLGNLPESAWFEVYDKGWTYFLVGQVEKAKKIIENQYRLARGKEGFERVEALAIGNLGSIAQEAGDYESALDKLERSLVLWQKIRDREWIAYAQARLGRLKHALGHLYEAKRLLEQAQELRFEIGHVGEVTEIQSVLALVEFELGNEGVALKLSEDSLIRSRLEIEPPSPSHAYALYYRAILEEKRGNLLEAKKRAREALRLYKNLGHIRYMGSTVRRLLERLESKEPSP